MSISTLDLDQLSTVSGGLAWPDLTEAVQAGNSAAPSYLAAGGFLGGAGKAAHTVATAAEAALHVHGKWGFVGAVGLGGAGWMYGFGHNLAQQEGWAAPAGKGGSEQ